MVNIKKHDSFSISKLDDQNLMLTDDFQLLELMIENYVYKMSVNSWSTNTAITLTAYDGYDLNTTLDTKKLPDFFLEESSRIFQ